MQRMGQASLCLALPPAGHRQSDSQRILFYAAKSKIGTWTHDWDLHCATPSGQSAAPLLHHLSKERIHSVEINSERERERERERREQKEADPGRINSRRE